MIPNRASPAQQANVDLTGDRVDTPAATTRSRRRGARSNREWLEATGAGEGIILLGGSSLAHFRVRVAQSHLRRDLFPSFWSLTGILQGDGTFLSVPLELRGSASDVPARNAVELCRLSEYDDPELFPNIALLHFADGAEAIAGAADRVRAQRAVIDLPSLVVAWLGFVWGAGHAGNPLLDGKGLPCAAFVEATHGLAGIELTPGLASTSSCPEAIWQSVKWWRPFYEETMAARAEPRQARTDHAVSTVPSGTYLIRQPAAAVHEPRQRRAGR
jgi:hypothetical protein